MSAGLFDELHGTGGFAFAETLYEEYATRVRSRETPHVATLQPRHRGGEISDG
jgi:hypothetical protein